MLVTMMQSYFLVVLEQLKICEFRYFNAQVYHKLLKILTYFIIHIIAIIRSTFAVDGKDCKMNKDVERVLKDFHRAGKPIG